MRSNEKGPHQISNVEVDSPAQLAGLRLNDLILKVADANVVGERYSKTVTLIKNELEKGRLKLEVVEPASCPAELRDIMPSPSSTQSTVASRKSSTAASKKSIENLKDITAEAIVSQRGLSADPGSFGERSIRSRPLSMNDLDRVGLSTNAAGGGGDAATIRSNKSAASNLSEHKTTAKSVGNLSTLVPSQQQQSQSQRSNVAVDSGKPKFKRCNVQLLPEYSGYGFTLNSKSKPKYSIFSVDPLSPAYAANLRTTDVIVEINRKNIRRLKFDKVKQMLSESHKDGHVEILAIDKAGYLYYKERRKRFSSTKLVRDDNTEPFSTLEGRLTDNNTLVSSPTGGDASLPAAADVTMSKSSQQASPALSHRQQMQLTSQSQVTGTDLDSYDIIACTVNRRSDTQSLGLSLSTAVSQPPQQPPASGGAASRSASRASRASGGMLGDEQTLPIITFVEQGSLAEASGLRAGDLVLEINGKSTIGQSNQTIASWIKSTGNTIEFLVSREKANKQQAQQAQQQQQQQQPATREPSVAPVPPSPTPSARQRSRKSTGVENLMQITSEAIQQQAAAVEPYVSEPASKSRSETVSSQGHVSRKDSVASQSQQAPVVRSAPGTPKIVHEEIKMSSSKLQQLADSPKLSMKSYEIVESAKPDYPFPASEQQQLQQQQQPAVQSVSMSSSKQVTPAPSPKLVRERNQSEPAPQEQPIKSSSPSPVNVNATVSPVSKRSASTYTLPRDAPIPRLCRVRAYEDQLGFTVAGSKASRGVFKVNEVTPNSPAAHSGLHNDDYIIEISGLNVEDMSYADVVALIKMKKLEDDLQLLVADRSTLQWYKAKKMPISSQLVPRMQYIETLLNEELQPELYSSANSAAAAAAAAAAVDTSLPVQQQFSSFDSAESKSTTSK